jgi:hypothetical protein
MPTEACRGVEPARQPGADLLAHGLSLLNHQPGRFVPLAGHVHPWSSSSGFVQQEDFKRRIFAVRPTMLKWIGYIIFWLLMTGFGLNCWIRNGYLYGKFLIPHFAGIAMTIYGLAMAILTVAKYNQIKADNEDYICTKCQNVVKLWQSPTKKCPKCSADLEVLKGFYERQPEFRTNTEDKNGQSENK